MQLCRWCFLQYIMHMTLSIIIMQVTLSFIAIRWQFQETISYSVLKLTASFHKIDQKTFKSIISGLHFTTSVNILPKLRYFEGKNDLQIGYKSYSVLLFCFLTAIWLRRSQLWATIKGQPHSPNAVTVFCIFGLKVTGSLVTRLGP